MPNSDGEPDGRPADEDPHLGAKNPGERRANPRGQQALLDCDGRQGETRAHQHRVLRILAELRAVFPVGPRIASLSDLVANPSMAMTIFNSSQAWDAPGRGIQ